MNRSARIEESLTKEFRPEVLEILDESSQHSSGRGAESHFRVRVVSSRFEGLSLIARHRLIYDALREELNHGLHALSVEAYSPKDWYKKGGEVRQSSPPCAHSQNRSEKKSSTSSPKDSI